MDEIRLPETFREWEITEKIGEGSFGIVYKARRRLGSGQTISAIKIISVPGDDAQDETLMVDLGSRDAVQAYYRDMLDSYLREIETLNELKGNSHIVSIEDYAIEENLEGVGWRIYIRMEYLESFMNRLAAEPMTEKQAVQLGMDICLALSDCEKLHIVHRDIKPENIFVTKLGSYKLGDFSEARYLEPTVSSLSQRGTISYIAPEVYKSTHYGAQADIYSLGIVLYRIMNRNRDPFVDSEKQMIYYKDREQAFERRMRGEALPKPPYASDAFSDIILKACAFDPMDRYLKADDMRKALEGLLQGGGAAGFAGAGRSTALDETLDPAAWRPAAAEKAVEKESRKEKGISLQLAVYGLLLILLPVIGAILFFVLKL